MTAQEPMSFGVIGAGAVGTAMAALLKKNGYKTHGISSRTEDRLEQSLNFLELDTTHGYTELGSWCGEVDLLFITVPDDHISTVATELSDRNLLTANTLTIHCSGAHSSQALLQPLEQDEKNMRIGSFHPLQTVPDAEAGVSDIPNAWIGIEGRSDVVDDLKTLADDLGARPFEVPGDKKTLYHLAAVFACNHVIGLLSIAEGLMEEATTDVRESIAPLKPLIERSLENSLKSSPSAALTGPAVRGDIETITSHLDALEAFDEEQSDLYIELTRYCFQIAVDRGTLSKNEMESFLSRIR